MKGKSNYKRLSAKEQVAKIKKEKLDKMILKFIAFKGIAYSYEFN